MKPIKLSNPLNEAAQFRILNSNTNNFGLEKVNDKITLEANSAIDLKVIFTPSTMGPSDHYCLLSFFNEKVGNITYELRGIGTEPDTQDPINITAEVYQSQLVTINFRNSTDSAIYCDLKILGKDLKGIILLYFFCFIYMIQCFKDENEKPILESNSQSSISDNQVYNILLDKLQNIHVSPKAMLDIPILFTPNDLKRFDAFMVVTARREARMSWSEQDSR